MRLRTAMLPVAVALMAQLPGAVCAGGRASPGGNSCHIEGIVDVARCYRIDVAERPGMADSRRIGLRVVVLPALGMPRHADPVFVLAGGPGQAASEYGGLITRMFEEVRKRRDVVLVDQRGSGDSNALQCALDPAEAGDFERLADALLDCRQRWSNDLSQYATPQSAADIEAVRRALDYPQINVWGGSYGTRLAQEYQRRYANHTRAVVLDGAIPFERAIPQNVARDTDRAWARLSADCRADADCAARFGDVDALLRRILTRLDAAPARLQGLDPHSGHELQSLIDASQVREIVRVALYSPSHSAWLPMALTQADAGDYAPLLSLRSLGMSWSVDTMTLGLTVNILCLEDVPRLDSVDLDIQRKETLFGTGYAQDWRRACARWPSAAHDAALSTGRSAVPTLVLSGELDPVTPPASGELVMSTLDHARHVIAANTGHNVSASGCAPRLIAAFFDAADAATLDTACMSRVRRPDFALIGSTASVFGVSP